MLALTLSGSGLGDVSLIFGAMFPSLVNGAEINALRTDPTGTIAQAAAASAAAAQALQAGAPTSVAQSAAVGAAMAQGAPLAVATAAATSIVASLTTGASDATAVAGAVAAAQAASTPFFKKPLFLIGATCGVIAAGIGGYTLIRNHRGR